MSDILDDTIITGADGVIGSYIDFGIKTNRRSLDITDRKQIWKVFSKYKPKVVLHLAALTDLEKCEAEPQLAYQINAVGTFNLALAAKEIEAKLIYISTNGVFDGLKTSPYVEQDIPNPQNIYGCSKYLGELSVNHLGSNSLIVRTSWIFGGGTGKDRKFVAKIMGLLKKDQQVIEAISNRLGTPTFAKDLVVATKELILNGTAGLVHVANKGECSRYDMVKEIVNHSGKSIEVKPVDSSHFPSYANQLINESLGSNVFSSARPWQEALREYLSTEWTQ